MSSGTFVLRRVVRWWVLEINIYKGEFRHASEVSVLIDFITNLLCIVEVTNIAK